MNTERRTFLRRLAALSVAAGLAGCGGTPGSTTDRGTSTLPDRETPTDSPTPTATETPNSLAEEWGFDSVVDVTELGVDPTGGAPIDDVVAEHIGAEELLYFPPGRYQLAESIAVSAVPRAGMVGADATIVPSEGNEDPMFSLGWPDPVGAAVFAGLSFDFSAEDTGGRPLLARGDDVLIEDVTLRGEADVDQDLFRVDVTDPDGSGMIRRLFLPDGAPPDTKVTGCEVGDDNRGDVSFVDCEIDRFPDNGLYADPPEGTVSVIGGKYQNNGVAGVRVEVSEDAVIRGVHVRCDDATRGGANMRGIRLRAGRSILVEDCLVEMLEVTSSDGAITFASELQSATVRNCLLHVDADGVNAIRMKSAAGGRSRRGPFVCESVTITGAAGQGAAIEAADREGVTFRDICLHQSGADRDGVLVDHLRGEFLDSSVSVTGSPFVLNESTLVRRNVDVREGAEAAAGGAGPCASGDIGNDTEFDR
ncbi:right-handed parallel beta-helix repeat-containing protein [Halobaculum lipolyticum]|uniref:Right-handed parallel beta-helix repeat-containing protein n=1 Tax=Halobaculum lipolyticum TaxID=3032001 RepID=A0ABD5WA18_9EURY|nr:right-handed parallel beta-helix repeat-containing protein [Halobaculum sp. DT31]